VDSKDFYSVLGVPRTADQATIRAAYRTLMRRYHPDARLEADTARAQQINEAYQVLGNPRERRKYDELSRPTPNKGPPPGFARGSEKKTRPRRKNRAPSKQSFQLASSSISESAAAWWFVAFIAAVFAFLYLGQR
jgi:curved DNA-binding protein CbpA